jgi:hypothetical protein
VKYKKGAVQGESKGYADLLDDIVAGGAKHYGISVAEFEQRLRNGDINLMSQMLAIPAVAAAYRERSAAQAPIFDAYAEPNP